MMKHLGPLLCSLLLLTTSPCGATPTPDNPVQQRAEQLITQFQKQLKSHLMTGLQQGPLQAISVCRERAPEIADQLTTNGVTIGRTSHKLRNSANTAPDWVRPLLVHYQHQAAPAAPSQVTLDNGDVGYVKPIYIKPPCLTCHGSQIDSQLNQQLQALYPEDAATDFNIGDFRGLFWVRLPQ